MKKFQFKLEPVLRYRRFLEQQQKMVVASARSAVHLCEADIENTVSLSRNAADVMAKDIAEGMDTTQFEWFTHYIEGLSKLRTSLETRRLELLKILYGKQKELTEKTVSRKVVENLKDRKKEEYYREALKNEQRVLDDMVILRSARKVNE